MTGQQKENLEEAIKVLRATGGELAALSQRFYRAAQMVQEATSYEPVCTENVGPETRWPEGISDGLTLPCGICGDVQKFDYNVDDDLWQGLVPIEHRYGVICLPCLDTLGNNQGICVGSGLNFVQFTGKFSTTVLRREKTYSFFDRLLAKPNSSENEEVKRA